MKHKTIYITTTLPYINADPHLGHALEFVQADVYVRAKRLMDNQVFFNTGTDEHGQKVYQKALEAGVDPQAYADRYADRFKQLLSALNVSEHNFIRTTDPEHISAAQEFWKLCEKNGDIYKKKYKGLYCVADEVFLTTRDLDENGRCKNHPENKPQEIEEENYFFRFSKYQEKLLELYKSPDFVVPQSRRNEIKSFVSHGLEDFSISRLKEKMPWGVDVPGDDKHVMYVWFDALVNYISTIGWPDDLEKFEKWWPVVQFAGKDNLGHQAARWQAMLMSAGLPSSKKIVIHGFITSGGHKMSKSVGNVVDPFDIIRRYGVDALRYYLLREVSPFEDSDFTEEKFIESYNGNLANGLGNLVSRVMKMAESHLIAYLAVQPPSSLGSPTTKFPQEFIDLLDNFEFGKAADFIWDKIGELDAYIQKTEPFKTVKTDKNKAIKDIEYLVTHLWEISDMLEPFLPETAQKIRVAIKNNEMPEPLFKRVE